MSKHLPKGDLKTLDNLALYLQHCRFHIVCAFARLLKMSDEELFENNDIDNNENIISLLQSNEKFRERREIYGRDVCKRMKDEELFLSSQSVNKYVEETEAYKERSAFCNMFLDGKTSWDILNAEKDTLKVVIQSSEYAERLRHLSKKEKSAVLGLQEAHNTVKILGKTSGKVSKDQKKVIAASLTSLQYGVPDLGLSWREESIAYEMKRRLINGQDNILRVPNRAVRQVLPVAVTEVAARYWDQITILEGAKHRRITTVVKDGEETVPTRYQTTTDDEAYLGFKETCADEVSSIMLEYSKEQKAKYENRQDSADKEYRLKYAESLPGKFPSKSWFIEQRPPEVKMIHDHSTGLCKVGKLIF